MRLRDCVLLAYLLLALAAPASVAREQDPAGRVARIAYLEGTASFAPAGVEEWAKAILNRPLIAGDRLYTEAGARLELELGGSALRLDERSAAEILDLDDEVAQFFLSEGRANLYVRRIFEGQFYEIATPVAAVVARSPVSLTVEMPPGGGPLRVAVWHGRAQVVGDGRRIELAGGEELLASDRSLADHVIRRDPQESDFERFAFARDRDFDRAESLRYVPDDLIGYRELDRYGSWSYVREYGSVWFPSQVSVGWAPYRYGHWVWLPVYGWTWVDDAPWGFAVSHYGRWIWWDGRWGWVPCPRRHRAYWAPALVVFYGGRNWSLSYASAPVGWFPLGPGDIWLPWYSVSWHYFHRINAWNTWVGYGTIYSVYNTVLIGGGVVINLHYRYRGRDFAWTFVPEENFRRGRPVHRHLLPVRREDIARAELRRVLGVMPTQASLKGAAPSARGVPDAGLFAREAVATRQPSPRAALPFGETGGSSTVSARTRGLTLVGEGQESGRGARFALPSVEEGARARGISPERSEASSSGSRRGVAGMAADASTEPLRRGSLSAFEGATPRSAGASPLRGRAPSPAEISERRAGALPPSAEWREGRSDLPRRGWSSSSESREAIVRAPENASTRGAGRDGLTLPSRSRLGESHGLETVGGREPFSRTAPYSRNPPPSSGTLISPRGSVPSPGSESLISPRGTPPSRSFEPRGSDPRGSFGERRPGSLIERAPAQELRFRDAGMETRSRPPIEGGWPGRDRFHSPSSIGETAPPINTAPRSYRGSSGAFEPRLPPSSRFGTVEHGPREPSSSAPARGGWSEPAPRHFRADPPVTRDIWDNTGPSSRGSLHRDFEYSPPVTEVPRGSSSREASPRSESPVREALRGRREE
ncbi:MAG: proline-rich exported protein [Lysobacterales bacterium]|jgi:hypothetical protein|nr:MAG: proline-rich exported protein [Xanthomonadales bacterium]